MFSLRAWFAWGRTRRKATDWPEVLRKVFVDDDNFYSAAFQYSKSDAFLLFFFYLSSLFLFSFYLFLFLFLLLLPFLLELSTVLPFRYPKSDAFTSSSFLFLLSFFVSPSYFFSFPSTSSSPTFHSIPIPVLKKRCLRIPFFSLSFFSSFHPFIFILLLLLSLLLFFTSWVYPGCMNGWLDGWTDRRMSDRLQGWLNDWLHGWTARWLSDGVSWHVGVCLAGSLAGYIFLVWSCLHLPTPRVKYIKSGGVKRSGSEGLAPSLGD